MTPDRNVQGTTLHDVSTRAGLRARRHQAGRSVAMLELEAARLNARVEELEREKAALEAFAAVAAHELVEPLVITEAYAAMVSDRLDDEVHAESLRDLAALSRTASRTRLLLEAILHDARVGEDMLVRRPVDLGSLVAECLSVLHPEVVERGACVRVGDLPTVEGDAALLSCLFTNLILNALKYSPRHGSAIVIEADREDDTWRIAVESEGPTIPVEDRERIFQAYQRGRGERRARGAGLGLAICRRIVERHGGDIGVVPAAGGGNRFHFTLPV
jgi:light-regulated signal transduction histidine kinase (bacteriophytochrome)